MKQRNAPVALFLAVASLFTSSTLGDLPPNWLRYPEDTIALEGDRVSFQCQAAGNGFIVRAHLQLAVDGSTPPINNVSGDWMVHFAPNQLVTVTILRFSNRTEGFYYCQGVNPNPNKDLIGPKRSFTIAIEPSPTSQFSPIVAVENTPVIVTCSFKGVPAPNVTLYRGNVQLETSEGGSLAHTISNAKRDDAGTYRCTAVNMAGRNETTRKLVVEYKPTVITTRNEPYRVANGTRANFECFADALPASTYEWRHNGSAIDLARSVVHVNGTLSVSILSLNDTGTYTCVARNPHGEDTRDFQVVVKVPPGPPGKPTKVRIGIHDITLTWAVGFDGHGTISEYKVQYQVESVNRWVQYDKDKKVNGPPATLTGLAPNKRYYFKLKAVNEVGRGDFGLPSDEVITHPLTPPKAETVVIDKIRPTQFTVSWQAPLGLNDSHGMIRHYTVRYYASGGSVSTVKFLNTTDGTEKEAILTDLAKGTRYTVDVSASNRIFSGPYSNPVTETTATTVPDAVVGFRAEPTNDRVVQLFWTFPADLGGLSITKTVVEYRVGSSSEWEEASIQPAPSDEATAVTGLTEKTSYVFRITIYNAVGPSSEAISSPVETPANEAPSQPTLSVAARHVSQIELGWTDSGVQHKATLWRIEQREPASSSTWVLTEDNIEGSLTGFTVENLSPNTTYVFRLRGSNRAGDGPWSSEHTARTLPQQKPDPVKVIQVKASFDGVVLLWDELPPADGELKVTLWWKKAGDSKNVSETVTPGANEFTVTGLESNTTYIVWLVTELDGLETESLRYNFTTQSETEEEEVKKTNGLSTGIIVAIGSVGGGLVLFFIILFICCCYSKTRSNKYNMSEDRPSSWIEGPVDASGWYKPDRSYETSANHQYSSFNANGRVAAESGDPMHSTTLSYVELQFTSPHHRPPRIQERIREETPYAEIDHDETTRRSRSRSVEIEVPITTLNLQFDSNGGQPKASSPPPPPFEPVASPTFESDV